MDGHIIPQCRDQRHEMRRLSNPLMINQHNMLGLVPGYMPVSTFSGIRPPWQEIIKTGVQAVVLAIAGFLTTAMLCSCQ